MTDEQTIEVVARAICAEQCAMYGEPPCYEHGWPNPNCDEPGCIALATAACAALLSERHRAEEAKWQSMDSAPKDGTRVLVAWKAFAGISEHVELGKWKQRDGWCNTYGKSFHGIPDYFMPLPALPLTPEPTHER